MFKDLLHLVFPRECPGCGNSLVQQEKFICLNCMQDFPQTHFHLDPEENELAMRFAGRERIEGAAGLFFFDKHGKFQKIISSLKYRNQPGIGDFLGEFYAHQLRDSDFIRPVTRILPVPLHPKRERERGYNQAFHIARGLGKGLDLPVGKDDLKRIKGTKSQTKKGPDARYENMKSVFEVNTPVAGHLLLVDDVITTGSTLLGCLRALRNQENPPESIRIACLGVARKA